MTPRSDSCSAPSHLIPSSFRTAMIEIRRHPARPSFLVENARIEIPQTPNKTSHIQIPNRERMAFFHRRRFVFTGRGSRITGRGLVTRLPAVAGHSLALRRLPAAEGSLITAFLRFSPSLATRHSSLVTVFLFGSPANRIPSNPLKKGRITFSNRLQTRGLHISLVTNHCLPSAFQAGRPFALS